MAGLMDLLDQEPALRRARVAVIFSGVRRRSLKDGEGASAEGGRRSADLHGQ